MAARNGLIGIFKKLVIHTPASVRFADGDLMVPMQLAIIHSRQNVEHRLYFDFFFEIFLGIQNKLSYKSK